MKRRNVLVFIKAPGKLKAVRLRRTPLKRHKGGVTHTVHTGMTQTAYTDVTHTAFKDAKGYADQLSNKADGHFLTRKKYPLGYEN